MGIHQMMFNKKAASGGPCSYSVDTTKTTSLVNDNSGGYTNSSTLNITTCSTGNIVVNIKTVISAIGSGYSGTTNTVYIDGVSRGGISTDEYSGQGVGTYTLSITLTGAASGTHSVYLATSGAGSGSASTFYIVSIGYNH